VTRRRLVTLALDVGWTIPWLFVLHAGAAWWVPPASGLALYFVAASRRRGALGPLAVAASLAAGFFFGSGPGLAAGGIGTWRGWAAHGTPERGGLLKRLVLVVVMLAVLVIWQPAWWPVLPAALVLAVVGMAEAERPPGVDRQEWWGLGTAFGLLAAGMAVVMYGLAVWGPWKYLAGPLTDLVSLMFEVIAYTVVRLLSRIHFHGLHIRRPKIQYKNRAQSHQPRLHPTGGHHLVLLVVLGVVGLALLALGLWWLGRSLAAWSPAAEDVEERLERRRIAARPGRESALVRHTRRVVQRRMRQALRRRIGAEAHETLREWFERVYGSAASASVTLYEEVRYGGAPDGAGRAAEADRAWPKDPSRPGRG